MVLLAKGSRNNTSKKIGFRWLTEVDFKLKSNCSLTTRDGVRVRRSFHANVVVENQMEKRKKFDQLVGSREKEE